MENGSFLSEAIQKIVNLSYGHVFEGPGGQYYDHGTNCTMLREPLDIPQPVSLCSLDALVTLTKAEAKTILDGVQLYVSVPSPTRVEVFTEPIDTERNQRRTLCTAEAVDVPGFKDTTFSYEQAIIALRSRFQPSDDQEYVLDLMAHLCSEQSVQSDDDGITQRVQVNSGIQMTKITAVKPIVKLRPYRTFQEVEQPASDFLIRLDDQRNLTVTQADGGMWRLAARTVVKAWLMDAFVEEIVGGKLSVML